MTIAIIEDFVAVYFAQTSGRKNSELPCLSPRFKYQLLSLCKSPNVEKAVTDYYTVSAFVSVRLLRSGKRYVEDACAANRLVLVENT